MVSKKKTYYVFEWDDDHYGAIVYTNSFATMIEVKEYVKELKPYDGVKIMQTSDDGSFDDFCYIAGPGDSRFSPGTVYSYDGDSRVFTALQDDDEWYEKKRHIGTVALGGVAGTRFYDEQGKEVPPVTLVPIGKTDDK